MRRIWRRGLGAASATSRRSCRPRPGAWPNCWGARPKSLPGRRLKTPAGCSTCRSALRVQHERRHHLPSTGEPMTFDWLKHAFAIEPPGAVQPTEAQAALIDRLCRMVVERKLTTPALLFLEGVRPLGYVTSQTLQFFGPLISALGDARAL